MRTRKKWQGLTALLVEFFRRQDFKVIEEVQFHSEYFDLFVDAAGSTAAVEVKVWSSKHIRLSPLLAAAAQVESGRARVDANYGVIAVTANVRPEIRNEIRAQFERVRIFDLETLTYIFSIYPDLDEQFSTLMSDVSVQSIDRQDGTRPIKLSELQEIVGRLKPRPPIDDRPRRDFCADLKKIPAGKAGWKAFEKTCFEALKYCLDGDLARWLNQSRSYSGINIFDTVCRISSDHDFWLMISNRFNTGYIVIEYKNYSGQVSQGQIYTTEKYLYRPAIRTVAFIVSRNGFDKNAAKAAAGALREHGKLILDLTIETICEMVSAKDQSEDVNAILFDLVDDLLVSIER